MRDPIATQFPRLSHYRGFPSHLWPTDRLCNSDGSMAPGTGTWGGPTISCNGDPRSLYPSLHLGTVPTSSKTELCTVQPIWTSRHVICRLSPNGLLHMYLPIWLRPPVNIPYVNSPLRNAFSGLDFCCYCCTERESPPPSKERRWPGRLILNVAGLGQTTWICIWSCFASPLSW